MFFLGYNSEDNLSEQSPEVEFASTRQHGKLVAYTNALNLYIKTCFIASM